MPRCYMVKKRTDEDSPPPCSPTEGSVAPQYYDEDARYAETHNAEYAQLENPLWGRSAAEREAAHELLSLAHSLPPLQSVSAPHPLPQFGSLPPFHSLPPHQPLPLLEPLPPLEHLPPLPPLQPRPQLLPQSATLLPVYTYTVQPTNIYIVTDNPPPPSAFDFCPCNYPNGSYIGYIYQQVPPETVYGPKPQPQPESVTDSDQEPQLEIVTDPDSEPEPEIDLEHELEPDIEPEPDSKLASYRRPESVSVITNFTHSDESTKLRSHDSSKSVVRSLYDLSALTEPEHGPSPTLSPDKISLHDMDLESRSHFYTESESSYLRYSEPESRALHYSEAVPLSESSTTHELRPNDLDVQPHQMVEQGLSPIQIWPNKKYVCTDCGKTYATSSNLSRHRQTHRSLDSLMAKRCEECGKIYVSMPALAMHVLTHRMGHVCSTCGKQFSRPWLLRGHLRSHTGEKPYGCHLCGKAFADRSNLRAHKQTHVSGRKYVCVLCKKEFPFKSFLIKHHETGCFLPEGK